jgi:hypothetical protein
MKGMQNKMKTLVFCLASRELYRNTIVAEGEIFLSPDEKCPNGKSRIRIPSGSPHINDIIKEYPHLRQPDLIFIKTDATRRNLVKGLSKLGCPSVISIADTHHLYRPIECLREYLDNEHFKVISVENDRHHLDWYSNSPRQKKELYWFPNYAFNPILTPQSLDRVPRVVFAGSQGRFHPYRCYILEKLKQKNIPLDSLSCSQQQAAELYSSYQISLNISLNQDLNWRFFEIIASGGFLLTDRLNSQSGINLLFTEGMHYEAFASDDELLYKVNYYLRNPEEALLIAERGCAHYWSTLNPTLMRKQLLGSAFDLNVEKRFIYPPFVSNLCSQWIIRVYQSLQEIHRITPYPHFLISARIKPALLTQIRHLSRATIIMWDNQYYDINSCLTTNEDLTLVLDNIHEIIELPGDGIIKLINRIVICENRPDNSDILIGDYNFSFNVQVDHYLRSDIN